MKYDFDTPVERRGSASYKWDGAEAVFGEPGLLPFWVADMDFRCAQPIVDALKKRAEEGIFGYTIRTGEYFDALRGWFRERDGWEIPAEQLIFAPPGVIFGIAVLLEVLTKPGDAVVMQTPNYDSLMDLVTCGGRRLIRNPMLVRDGRYTIDYEGLEQLMQTENVRLLLMDNPNNPTGRLWTEEELRRLAELCLRYDVFILSDDIHSDIRPKGSVYTPILSISEEIAERSIVCTSTNKTFNLGGLAMGTFVIPSKAVRDAYNDRMKQYQTRLDSIFGVTALIAAYSECGDWVDQMNDYVCANRRWLEQALREKLPGAVCHPMDATYFSWVDLSCLGKDAGLQEYLVRECGLAFTPGTDFDEHGDNFVRINLACPRSNLEEMVRRLVP